MARKTIFSGIKPSGALHIGNYIGAIKQWKDLQTKPDNRLIFCIVDLHAITVYQDPKALKKATYDLIAFYMASGIDPDKSTIFVQSDNIYHSYLSWIIDCVVPMGWMERMTQYKDKLVNQKKKGEIVSVGFFNYPALMAADILLYDADLVPVGEDQTQHLELTRNIARRFNRIYGKIFVIPKPMIDKKSARVMSLSSPEEKMSKSVRDPNGTIDLLDSPDEIRRKISRAVTDSDSHIEYNPEKKPAISNLLVIYSKFSGKGIENVEKQYTGGGYAQFKKDLAEVIIEGLRPIQNKYNRLSNDKSYLDKALKQSTQQVIEIAQKKMKIVIEAVGLGR